MFTNWFKTTLVNSVHQILISLIGGK